jgi:hypothetical protein
MSKPPIINTSAVSSLICGMGSHAILSLPLASQMVKSKLEMLEALADIQFTTNLLKSLIDPTVNPIDSKYESLHCDLKPVDKESDRFKLIEDYTANTHGHTHTYYKLKVEEVFEVSCWKHKMFCSYSNTMGL